VSSQNDNSQAGKGPRGRKVTETTKYIKDSKKKIADWNKELKKPKLSLDEKHSLRNKISALESRVTKREEHRDLLAKIKTRRDNFMKIAEVIGHHSCRDCTGALCEQVRDSIPITGELSFKPLVANSISSNTQMGGRMTRKEQPSKIEKHNSSRHEKRDLKSEL
jgi:hypothetical protein